MPYLILSDGQAFLDFSKNVFGASEQMVSRDESNAIRHGEIRIGDAVIMFGQSTEDWAGKSAGMFIYVADVDQVYDAGLRHHAIALMPPGRKDYGYTAGFEDPFGNQWWIVQGE